MKASILELETKRPLSIDFTFYTDGDSVFKKELITLMIENIRELLYAQRQAEYQNDFSLFLKACHKVNSTLNILNDNELRTVVNQMIAAAEARDAWEPLQIALLHRLCDEIVKSLEQEKNSAI